MKRILVLLIAIFYVSISNAQIRDSINPINRIDSVKVTKGIDTIINLSINDSLKMDIFNLRKRIDSILLDRKLDSLRLDSIKKHEFVYIKKSLLDSLLKPYYDIKIDTLKPFIPRLDSIMKDSVKIERIVLNPIADGTKPTDSIRMDSLAFKTTYISKYRIEINPFSSDTSYVPLPKSENYITVKNTYDIRSIDIRNPIKTVKMNKLDYGKDPEWWVNKNSIALDVNEVAFVNWNAGGVNSVSGLLKIYFGKTFKKELTLWNSEVFVRYGLNKQDGRELRKTDDQFRINSTFGYRRNSISNWYYSMKFNFNTQFTDGYKYPNTDDPISRFFAPAYMFFGAGTQYNLEKEHFTVYISPLTLKSTFVLDETLSNNGDFGVVKGDRSRHEFGTLIESTWNTEVLTNVAMMNRLSLYSDYLNKFGNIDVIWELKFKMKINKYLEANLGTHLIYDDDIKYKEDTNGDGQLETFGARVQLKQHLGIGVLYNF